MIPDDVIAEIRSRVDIVAVIGEHVQLRKAGRNWKGLCPFHGEKTPSFSVSPDKGFFYCFGCHKKGDAFSFVMEYGGRSFTEAAEQLAARTGVVLPQIEESPELRRARGERHAMLELNRVATDFFREVLAHPQRGAPGRAYLEKRGIEPAIRDRFQLGYAPADWRALGDHLKARRQDIELAVKLGLVAPQPRAGGYYDRYRERLVCPVIMPGGDVAGFSARVVDGVPGLAAPNDRDPPPKYFNSPESLVYKKSKLLFGLAQARESIGARKRAVLVEGNFDVISMHQAGFTEVVAPLGTAITAEQVDLLRRLAEAVYLFYDGDRAGYAATLHALQLCAAADVEVRVMGPGPVRTAGLGAHDGSDPDSLLAQGAEQISQRIERAREGVEHFATEVWGRARGSSAAMSRALDDAVSVITKVANATTRELIVGKLAAALDVDRGVILRALGRAEKRGTSPDREQAPRAPAPTPTQPPPTDEVEVVALCADHPDLVTSAEADKAFSLLTDARLRDICSAARAGESLVDLATSPESGLSTAIATIVLSGKYAATSTGDARALLALMASNLSHRTMAGGPGKRGTVLAELQARLVDAQRKGDRDLARQLANQIISIRSTGAAPGEPKAG